MSLDLLITLSNREAYERFSPFVKEHTVSKEVWQIIRDMSDYYASGEEEIDWERFKTWFKTTQHPTIKTDRIQVYDQIFDTVKRWEPSSLTDAIVESLVKRDFCTRIADITLKGAEGNPVDMAEVSSLLDAYENQSRDATRINDYIVTGDIGEVIESTTGPGLEWPGYPFNASCGPLRKGDLVVFGGRPDSGKTTWAAWVTANFVPQSDKPVLWFNNEQEGRKVKARFVQAMIQWTTADMRANPIGARDEFMRKAGKGIDDSIIVFDKAAMYPRDVEQILRKHEGCAIVFDQLWKFHGFEKSAGNEVSRQALLFQWAREICKEHAPVLALHQADGSAEGQEWIDMGQLYGSKTAIQGEADLLVTMGRSSDPTKQNSRYIQFPKNKMAGGGAAFDEGARHERYEMTFDPMRARFID